MGNIPRSSVGGRYFLNLDGAKAGYLKSVDGGAIKAEVVAERTGTGAPPKKHLGAVRIQEVELEVDQNRRGVRWVVTLRRNGTLVGRRVRLTRGESGSFEARFVTRNAPGADRFVARAARLGERCVARATFA